MYKFPEEIQNYLEKFPAYQDYLNSNQGDYRYLRCEFPQLMGRSTLRRPSWLARSINYLNYYDKGNQERLMRPRVNRVKLLQNSDDPHPVLRRAGIQLDNRILETTEWGEIRTGTWKRNNDAPVLIKVFDKSKPASEEEEKLLALEICKNHEVEHVNFVHYYGNLESKLLKYHVFEHMSRGTLLDLLRSENVMTRNLLTDNIMRKMFCQILFAVCHLHDMDLIHRNLKLENILVNQYFDIRIKDVIFLERTMAQYRGSDYLITKINFFTEYGPKKYWSPERAKKNPFNPFLDQVWALGVILYAMIHRKFPFSFQEGDKDQIDGQLAKGVKLPRSSYPPGLQAFFKLIFQKEEKRPRAFELYDYEWVASDPLAADFLKANIVTHQAPPNDDGGEQPLAPKENLTCKITEPYEPNVIIEEEETESEQLTTLYTSNLKISQSTPS